MPSSRSPSTGPAPTVVDARDAFFGYYPGTVAVVTSRHGRERNVMSAGWHAALSADPPMYGVAIAPERHSHGLITASGGFVVSFLPFAEAEAIAGAGTLSGAGGLDKLARLGLRWHDEEVSGLPILDAAYLSYVCELRQRVPTGDHEFFVGEVRRLHYDPAAFADRVQDSDAVPAVVYYGRSEYEALGSGPRATFPPERFRDEGDRR
jgi:flavin reductase (DIM6/NTAB) family NADH-FMN oxidoreductase RutF